MSPLFRHKGNNKKKNTFNTQEGLTFALNKINNSSKLVGKITFCNWILIAKGLNFIF